MKTKVLVCMVSVLVFILSSVVQGADLECQKLHDKYRVCVEAEGAGRNLDFYVCQGYGDKITCESNKCYWDTIKNHCSLDICVNDGIASDWSGPDGKVSTPDYSVLKWDFGRMDCPKTPDVPAPAPVPKTGQTTLSAIGDDGDLEKGVAWPNPRFTDNGNVTVTDNLTGLIWLKNANCFDIRNWSQALTDCNGLNSGECGLTDGSSEGDWRLPNRSEINSLVDVAYYNPALSNTAGTGQWSAGNPFTNVQSDSYWSSTTHASDTDGAWVVDMVYGYVYSDGKSYHYYVWPVRGGQ